MNGTYQIKVYEKVLGPIISSYGHPRFQKQYYERKLYLEMLAELKFKSRIYKNDGTIEDIIIIKDCNSSNEYRYISGKDATIQKKDDECITFVYSLEMEHIR